MLLTAFVAAALGFMLLTALLNAWMLPRLQVSTHRAGNQAARMALSVLIPARNEVDNIGPAIYSLLRQEDVILELLVLDDQSDDGTAATARAAAAGDTRVRVLTGAPLPPGWIGKPWACQQLGDAARFDLLLFTDADVIWEPGALAALVAEASAQRADLLTAWPTQITIGWVERLTVPLMAMTVLGYLPIWFVNQTTLPYTGIAIGQCLLFRRTAYEVIGRHAAVSAEIVDDMALAQAIKRQGLRLHMMDANGLIRCRMYKRQRAAFYGYAKNILAGHGGSTIGLVASAFFHWLVFVMPWLWLTLGWFAKEMFGWPWIPLLFTAVGVAIRSITAASTGQRISDALLLPFSVIMMTGIAAQSLWWQWRYGGPQWKGRVI